MDVKTEDIKVEDDVTYGKSVTSDSETVTRARWHVLLSLVRHNIG